MKHTSYPQGFMSFVFRHLCTLKSILCCYVVCYFCIPKPPAASVFRIEVTGARIRNWPCRENRRVMCCRKELPLVDLKWPTPCSPHSVWNKFPPIFYINPHVPLLSLLPRSWRHHVPLKHGKLLPILHVVIVRKIKITVDYM